MARNHKSRAILTKWTADVNGHSVDFEVYADHTLTASEMRERVLETRTLEDDLRSGAKPMITTMHDAKHATPDFRIQQRQLRSSTPAIVAEVRLPRLHHFTSTSAAYDACQCDESVQAGDTLVIASEGVVGVADTWPLAVTVDAGELHTLKMGESLGRIDLAWLEARSVAHRLGFVTRI